MPAPALVRPWGLRLPGRLPAAGLWATTALLLLHSVPSVPDRAAPAVGARTTADLDPMARFATLLYEPFSMVGGLLSALATLGRRLTAQPRPAASTANPTTAREQAASGPRLVHGP